MALYGAAAAVLSGLERGEGGLSGLVYGSRFPVRGGAGRGGGVRGGPGGCSARDRAVPLPPRSTPGSCTRWWPRPCATPRCWRRCWKAPRCCGPRGGCRCRWPR